MADEVCENCGQPIVQMITKKWQHTDGSIACKPVETYQHTKRVAKP